jgi:hypothetical protein
MIMISIAENVHKPLGDNCNTFGMRFERLFNELMMPNLW